MIDPQSTKLATIRCCFRIEKRWWARTTKPLTVVATVLALAGCRPYHMYRGGIRPESQLSRVTRSYFVKLMDIDGKDTGISKEFLILPGEHSIAVDVYRPGVGGSRSRPSRVYVCGCILELVTEAGRHYHVEGGELDGREWGAWAVVSTALMKKPWADVKAGEPPHCRCETWE